jgi:hypothetical protein
MPAIIKNNTIPKTLISLNLRFEVKLLIYFNLQEF